MKLINLYIILLIILSCNSGGRNEKVDQTQSSADTSNSNVNSSLKTDKEDYGTNSAALTIDDNVFTVIQNDPRSSKKIDLIILNEKKDTIYHHDGYATNGFELEDFNKDGVMDIRLYQITNVGGISELIMFDKVEKRFRPVLNFDNFSDPLRIKNTNLWYSYHGSGCADIDWGSELIKIENYKVIEIGDIEGIGCEGEEAPGIYAYKVNGDLRTQIYFQKRTPGYFEGKWDFIENYWNKNYRKFE